MLWYKCGLILRSLIQLNVNFFVRVSGQFFVIIKFATDVFTNNTSSIVLAIIKHVSVMRFQICSIVVSIYIKYWCFENICNKDCLKYSHLSESFVNSWIKKSAGAISFIWSSVQNCRDRLSTFSIICMTWFLLNLNLFWTVKDERYMYLLVCF